MDELSDFPPWDLSTSISPPHWLVMSPLSLESLPLPALEGTSTLPCSLRVVCAGCRS